MLRCPLPGLGGRGEAAAFRIPKAFKQHRLWDAPASFIIPIALPMTWDTDILNPPSDLPPSCRGSRQRVSSVGWLPSLQSLSPIAGSLKFTRPRIYKA
jgi:hypothetical protein